MISRLGLMGNMRKPGILPLCKRIIRWSRRKGVAIHAESALYDALAVKGKRTGLNRESFDSCDLICLIGGDGFFLNACRRLYPSPTPILPVNLGSLGFHAQIDPEDILTTLNRFYKDSIPTVPRYLLKISPSFERSGVESEIALNDALLVKETQSRMVHIEVFIDGVFLGSVPCDGMVISSATGSTAYNLSSGGPLVHPDLDIMVIFPICAHTLSIRPMAIPGRSRITLRHVTLKDREEAKVCIDGQIWWDILPGEEFEVSTVASPLLIANAEPGIFYRKVSSVIRWGSSLLRRNP